VGRSFIPEGSRLRPFARRLVQAARRARAYPALRSGQLNSTRPLSTAYGLDRGTPIDRLYIEDFLGRHSSDIAGRVLEVGDDSYSRRFGGDRVRVQDVLHLHDGNANATVIGDLADPTTLPAGLFDCIVLTQTLQYVFELPAALANLHRALRPGGVLLITVPAIAPLCDGEWQESHFWLFTPASVERLLAAEFGRDRIEVGALGNLYSATAFLHGAAAEEVDRGKLRETDPHYPVTITARAVA
jgi:SAM-dependent methyltransferase